MSEANGVLRNPYHPPGATIYREKRLTNQSYRLFSQPLLFFISQDYLTVADIYEDGGVAMDISVQD